MLKSSHRWPEAAQTTNENLPALASEAWNKAEKILRDYLLEPQHYTQHVNHRNILRLGQLAAAVSVQAHPWDEAERNDTTLRLLALEAIVEVPELHHLAKALGAMRVHSEDTDSVTFEVPSVSEPGTFYRPVLNKRTLAVTCGCKGATRGTGRDCWHKTEAKHIYSLLNPVSAVQLIQIEDRTDRAFDVEDSKPESEHIARREYVEAVATWAPVDWSYLLED